MNGSPWTPLPSAGEPPVADAAIGTRERILEAAGGLFRHAGYEGTSISDIGRAVGISGPAVYHHFDSKQRILSICCERAAANQVEQGQRALRQATPLRQLVIFVYSDCVYQMRSLEGARRYGSGAYTFRELVKALTEEDQRHIRALRQAIFEAPRTIVRAGVADGSFEAVDPTAITFALFGMTHQAVAWFRPDGGLSVDELGRIYAYNAAKMLLHSSQADAIRAELCDLSLS